MLTKEQAEIISEAVFLLRGLPLTIFDVPRVLARLGFDLSDPDVIEFAMDEWELSQ